jgi:hypothetical protein
MSASCTNECPTARSILFIIYVDSNAAQSALGICRKMVKNHNFYNNKMLQLPILVKRVITIYNGCNLTLYRCVCGHPGAKNRDYSVVTRFSARARKTAPEAGALPKAIFGTQIQCQVAPIYNKLT